MCSCGKSTFKPTYPKRSRTKKTDTCIYDLKIMQDLLESDKLSVMEKSIIKSQINVYNTNCNMFSNFIENAIQKTNPGSLWN